jgi:hypothetical protein
MGRLDSLIFPGSVFGKGVTSIEAAAICQAMVMAYLALQLVIEQGTYRRIVLSFMCDYWRKVVEEQKFRFTAPAAVETAFEQAISEPPEFRAQAVIRTVFSGLKIPLSKYQQIADWLKGTHQSRNAIR